MAKPLGLLVARFMRLPRVDSETWQGRIVRTPTWTLGPDGAPVRPRIAIWVTRRTGRINLAPIDAGPDAASPMDTAVAALCEFGLARNQAGGVRPARVEVDDADLAAHIRVTVPDPDLDVAVVDELRDLLEPLESLTINLTGRPPLPGPLDGPGVTVDRLRAFAEAAKAFAAAAPWRLLTNDDLIRVEAPAGPAALRHIVVMGGAGQTRGLAFLDSEQDFGRLLASADPFEYFGDRAAWAVHFDPITEIPLPDADVFEAHGLPVAGPLDFPYAARMGVSGDMERPDAAALAWMEGLLRALAGVSDAELDAGRWRATVDTAGGALAFTFALPDLVDDRPRHAPSGLPDRRAMERVMAEMQRLLADRKFESLDEVNALVEEQISGRRIDEIPSSATTPLERAQDLIYQAYEASGRRQLRLAREAIALSPDCADAYVLLAERAWDAGEAERLYREAIAAGRRALGPLADDERGHLWMHVAARGYLRAHTGLAGHLGLARVDEAIELYREALRLDEDDHQGARFDLLVLLLEQQRDEDARALLEAFDEEDEAIWLYGRALSLYRAGDLPAARAALDVALRANRHVPGYLADPDTIPPAGHTAFELGSREEAAIAALELIDAWDATPGAIEWLGKAARRHGPTGRRRSKKKRR